jgi:hypothetical protein
VTDWPRYWKLDAAGEPEPCADFEEYCRWRASVDDSGEWQIARDADELTGWQVSTVFLGLDHQHGIGPPVLWETMVFGGPLEGDCERYTSRAAALAGHAETCARVAEVIAAGRPVEPEK